MGKKINYTCDVCKNDIKGVGSKLVLGEFSFDTNGGVECTAPNKTIMVYCCQICSEDLIHKFN